MNDLIETAKDVLNNVDEASINSKPLGMIQKLGREIQFDANDIAAAKASDKLQRTLKIMQKARNDIARLKSDIKRGL